MLPTAGWPGEAVGSVAVARPGRPDTLQQHRQQPRPQRHQPWFSATWLGAAGHQRPLAMMAATKARCRFIGRSTRTPITAVAAAAGTTTGDLKNFMIPPKRFPGASVVAFVRAFFLGLWLYILGCIFVPVIALVLPFAKRREPERRSLVDFWIRSWARWTCFPFFKVEIIGKENLLPPDQPCIYVANHQSFMDILSSLHLPRSFKFISKASIFKLPSVGWAMKAADHVALDREDRKSQVEVFRKSVKKLGAGTSLFIFPEGTRSKDGKMLEFKAKGPFGMARRAKVPLVPITILGTGRMMPGGKEYQLFYSGSGVRVIIHPQITAAQVEELQDDDLVERARVAVESGLPEAYRRAGRADV